jgi:hypothetical protein
MGRLVIHMQVMQLRMFMGFVEEMKGNPDKILALIHPEDIVLVMQKINATKSQLTALK